MKTEISKPRSAGYVALLVLIGTLSNLLLHYAAVFLRLPLYLDSLGTVVSAMLGGSLPAILVGFFTNLAAGIFNTNELYFGIINVLIAVMAALLFRRKGYKKPVRVISLIVILTVICAVIGTVISYFIGMQIHADPLAEILGKLFAGAGAEDGFTRLLAIDFVLELLDKAAVVLLSLAVFALIPAAVKRMFEVIAHSDIFEKTKRRTNRSLLMKVIAIVLLAEVLLGTLACSIGFFLYRAASIRKFSDICTGVVRMALTQIDPEKVDEYIEKGKATTGYGDVETQLYRIKNSFDQIEYLYCYRIEKEGCRVVFDLSTEDVEGSEPGSIVEFDPSFEEYLPALFAGEEIEPIISDDSYGWLLTVYKPIKDTSGQCVCYMAADISMDEIVTDEAVFMIKMISLFFGLSIIIIGIVLELVKDYAVLPIDAMANEAGSFAFETDEGRASSLEKLKELGIRSGDEIENLYVALTKLAEQSTEYIGKVKKQSETITKMQEDIIIDFAEMVEARDKCTGDHIKKTSYYVGVIAEEMLRRGDYPDILNREYIRKLIRSAPLHDVGKIKISDVILNKPGRLTEEEFSLMKTHTTEGKAILSRTSSISESSGYLKEAVEMAAYHHERWDGTGYPERLKGEEIPLSARIMAVADVFDALVSQRSYKQPFPFEKATSIIREESGTHFDPKVADAFLAVAEDAYNKV